MSTTTYTQIQRWRTKARQWATKYCGDKCQLCGYDSYIGNLVFHHIDPATKQGEVCRLIARCQSWATILTEINKCVLVCHNCHGEIHAGLKQCPEIDINARQEILASFEKPLPLTKQFHRCPCSKIIKRTIKFCSKRCYYLHRQVIAWPENLPDLVKSTSKCAVALALGVSDKAVAKRLTNHHQSR